jgi:TPR repeat protein
VATTSAPAGDEDNGAVKKNLQKALKYFSLAGPCILVVVCLFLSFMSYLLNLINHTAQSGHMGALHKVGQMYAQGMAAARSCTTAVHAFKHRTICLML